MWFIFNFCSVHNTACLNMFNTIVHLSLIKQMKNKNNESSKNADDSDWIPRSLSMNVIVVIIGCYILN